MDTFLNPQIYKIENIEIDGIPHTGHYFQDDKGRDWYETLLKWKGAVALDSSGIVCAYESDVSYMGMEEGRSVYEVDPGKVPDNVLGHFSFSNGVFTDIRPTAEDMANRQKAELLREAGEKISVLQDAVDFSQATEDEVAQLKAWRLYRVQLNKTDTTSAPDVIWPDRPE